MTSKLPRVRSEKLLMPAVFVAVDRPTFVLDLVALTTAFGAKAPLWSLTSPVMGPAVCESAATAYKHHTIANKDIVDRFGADAVLARPFALRICTFDKRDLILLDLERGAFRPMLQTFANLSENTIAKHRVSIDKFYVLCIYAPF